MQNESSRNEGYEQLLYYFADLTRQQARDILSRYAHTPGTFLARQSSEPNKLAISVVISPNRIGHVVISTLQPNCFYVDRRFVFGSVKELVEFYETNYLPNAGSSDITARLKYPIYKFRDMMPHPSLVESHTPQMRQMPQNEGQYCSPSDAYLTVRDDQQREVIRCSGLEENRPTYLHSTESFKNLPPPPPIPMRVRADPPRPDDDVTAPKSFYSSSTNKHDALRYFCASSQTELAVYTPMRSVCI